MTSCARTSWLLLSLAACAGPIAHPTPEPRDLPADTQSVEPADGGGRRLRYFEPAGGLATEREIVDYLRILPAERVHEVLEARHSAAERSWIGFCEVSLTQCVDRIARALAQEAAGDPAGSSAVHSSLELYWLVDQELRVRRATGAASCLPQRHDD